MGTLETLCPGCGPDVGLDEDGLCVTCGATATGDGVAAVLEAIAAKDARIAAIESELATYRAEVVDQSGNLSGLRSWAENNRRMGVEPEASAAVLALADAYEAKCGEVVRLKGQAAEVRDVVDHFHRCELYGPAPDDIARAVRALQAEVDAQLAAMCPNRDPCRLTLRAAAQDVIRRAGVYDAIEAAAGDLPEGYVIGISVERGAAGVCLVDEDGEEMDVEIYDGDIAAAIREATAKAAGGAQ